MAFLDKSGKKTYFRKKNRKMKNYLIIAAMALLTASCGSDETKKAPVTFADDNDKLSYSIGLDAGREIFSAMKMQGMDQSLNRELLVRGLEDAILENSPALSFDSAKMIIRNYFMGQQEARMQDELKKYESNKEEGAKFLAENKARAGVKTTETGLQYEVIKMGNGAKPVLGDSAVVHYTGTFINGEKFDSSVDRGEEFTFLVNFGQVIDGWVEAVQLMPIGSKFKVYLPHDLAYGESMRPGMPPYSTLIFEIEMIRIIKGS